MDYYDLVVFASFPDGQWAVQLYKNGHHSVNLIMTAIVFEDLAATLLAGCWANSECIDAFNAECTRLRVTDLLYWPKEV